MIIKRGLRGLHLSFFLTFQINVNSTLTLQDQKQKTKTKTTENEIKERVVYLLTTP